jgi:(p)ppGpp synthase/HD superfamily hydrolase
MHIFNYNTKIKNYDMDNSEGVYDRAVSYAKEIHKGQKYKVGNVEHDYFDYHVMGVVNSIKAKFGDKTFKSRALAILAVLHDSIEDCNDTINMTDLKSKVGLSDYLAHYLYVLTKDKDMSYADYILNIRGEELCEIVKLHDLDFNSRHSTGARKDKYELAMALINI